MSKRDIGNGPATMSVGFAPDRTARALDAIGVALRTLGFALGLYVPTAILYKYDTIRYVGSRSRTRIYVGHEAHCQCRMCPDVGPYETEPSAHGRT